jgi:serine/threonine protein kinase
MDALLYEMLTGGGAFSGETTSDILAAVIRAEPDWSAVPDSVPQGIRELLRRCLQKDPRQRFGLRLNKPPPVQGGKEPQPRPKPP